MRSRTERGRHLALIAAALLLSAPPCADAAQARGRGIDAPPDVAQIERALEKVRADPNVTSEQKVHTLRWAQHESSLPKWLHLPSWLRWLIPVLKAIAGLFRWFVGAVAWLGESGRMLLWVAAAVLVGLLVVYLVRAFKMRGPAGSSGRYTAPSHVRDLDIRPESLPADLGTAALALWRQGDQRGALALLYRGLLSRLVHAWRVPIRDSSTEGDCLVLAVRLGPQQRDYATRLIRSWQLAVYGGQTLDDATVAELCTQFAAALDPPPAAEAEAGALAQQSA